MTHLVDRACRTEFRARGFKPTSQVLMRPVGENSLFRVGFNTITSGAPEKIEINPVVGVSYPRLAAILRDLLQEDTLRESGVARPLGYLMPDPGLRTWVFARGDDLAALAQEMAEDVETYGLSFARHWGDWSVFSNEIAASGLLLDVRAAETLPAIALLNGDSATAREFVEREVARLGDAQDVYTVAYRQFAQRVREWQD